VYQGISPFSDPESGVLPLDDPAPLAQPCAFAAILWIRPKAFVQLVCKSAAARAYQEVVMFIRCKFCGKPLDPDSRVETVYQRVYGWEKKREAGGANQITLREPQQEWAHASCIDRMVHGIGVSQMAL
jgi:hypothetical protein